MAMDDQSFEFHEDSLIAEITFFTLKEYTCSICFWIDNLDIKTENHHEKAATNNERNSLLMIKKKTKHCARNIQGFFYCFGWV